MKPHFKQWALFLPKAAAPATKAAPTTPYEPGYGTDIKAMVSSSGQNSAFDLHFWRLTANHDLFLHSLTETINIYWASIYYQALKYT